MNFYKAKALLVIFGLIGCFAIAGGYLMFPSDNNKTDNQIPDKCNIEYFSDISLNFLIVKGIPSICENFTIINDKNFTEFNGHMLKVISYKDNTRTSVYEIQVDSKIKTLFDDSNCVEIDDKIYITKHHSFESNGVIYTEIGEICEYAIEFDDYNFHDSNYWGENDCGLCVGHKLKDGCFIIRFKSRVSYEEFPYLNSEHLYDGYIIINPYSEELRNFFIELNNEDLSTISNKVYSMVYINLDFYRQKCIISCDDLQSVEVDFQYDDFQIMDGI